jgi:hypothetical protein
LQSTPENVDEGKKFELNKLHEGENSFEGGIKRLYVRSCEVNQSQFAELIQFLNSFCEKKDDRGKLCKRKELN